MGSKKHKKHKSERRERYEGKKMHHFIDNNFLAPRLFQNTARIKILHF